MDEHYKMLGEAMARRMHPDLDWPKPNKEVKNTIDRYQLIDELELLWKMAVHPDLEIAMDWAPKTMNCTVYSKIFKIDPEATRIRLAKAMKALQSFGAKIEKEYDDNYFKIRGTFSIGMVFTLTANREVACVKRVVGTEYVPPTVIKGHTKEIVEWDCERISFSELN